MYLPDPKTMAEAIMRAIEADVAAAQARVAKVDAQPVPDAGQFTGDRVCIRIDARRGRQFTHAWVIGVSFKDGDGYQILKVSYSDVAVKARFFGVECARAVARQLAAGGYRNVTLEGK